MMDVLIRGGTIVDGTGRPAYKADIAIADGRIAEIGAPQGEAAATLDAEGLTVAPGFVDLHTHSDFTLAANGRAESQVRQGVTTEVVGQCGVSCAPARSSADIALMAPGFTKGAVELDWLSFGEYLDHLDRHAAGRQRRGLRRARHPAPRGLRRRAARGRRGRDGGHRPAAGGEP
jgi:N-acyl-D-amino-acid deacylase